MELAIVVAGRSWFEIYLRKTGKYRKKEKGAYKKEERWHPNSRAQPPRIEYTQLAPSDNRSTKSADGRVATGAAWLKGRNSQGGREEKKHPYKKKKRKNRKTHLTHTGLLMEGLVPPWKPDSFRLADHSLSWHRPRLRHMR